LRPLSTHSGHDRFRPIADITKVIAEGLRHIPCHQTHLGMD